MKKTGYINMNTEDYSRLNEAQSNLVSDNLELAYSRAWYFYKKYLKSGITLDEEDFISYALEGLCVATSKFDPKRGVKFSTFATRCIDNFIITNIYYENSLIRFPYTSSNKELERKYRNMSLTNSSVFSIYETMEHLDGDACFATASPVLKDCSRLYDLIDDEILFEKYMSELSDTEKGIFKCLVVNGLTTNETCDELGMHSNTIYRGKDRIKKKLKDIV